MIKRVTYGESWSEYYQEWRNPMTEAEARRRHEARQIYTALIEQDDGSTVELELCFGFAWCHLMFHDHKGRTVLSYSFEPAGEGRLFLSEITTGEYEGDRRLAVRGIAKRFTPEGRVRTLLSERRKLTVLGEDEPADIRDHFEPLPAFGDWASLIRRDRTRPPT